MFILIFILISLGVFAGREASSPPYQDLPEDYTIEQQATPCIMPLDQNWKFTAVAHNPEYDEAEQLTSYSKTDGVVIDKNFQDSSPQFNNTIPNGWTAHDTVFKVKCKKGYYVSNVSGVSTNYIRQQYFMARCVSGYLKVCHNNYDANMARYYTKYSGTYKSCLQSQKSTMVECRKMCDVTRLHKDTEYNITGKSDIHTVYDFIGMDINGGPINIIYHYKPPKDNINVQCTGGNKLAHSTKLYKGKQNGVPLYDIKNFIDFKVHCHKDGYITYPVDARDRSVCLEGYACVVPSNDANRRFGVYRKGKWTWVPKTFHDSYVNIRCGTDKQNDERILTCLNGNLLPDADLNCRT